MRGTESEVEVVRDPDDEAHLAERVVDGEMTVVVMCSRCPTETPIGASTSSPWNVVLIDTGRRMQHKVLCNACASELQQWFLSPGGRNVVSR